MGQTKEIINYAVSLDSISILAWMVKSGQEENDPKLRKCLKGVLKEETKRYDNCTMM